MNATMKAIRNIFAAILLIICLCISMAGCTNNQTTTTGEAVKVQNPSDTTDAQIPEETDSVTTPNTEATIPPITESTPTESVHIHSYTSKITDPSCTENGYTTFICDCGNAYTADQTNAVGHNYNKKVTAPSCTEKGYTTYTCSVCGNSYTDNKTNATGHSWNGWKVTKEPTATAEGAEQRTCKTCGTTESRSIDKLPEPVYETVSGTINSYNAHNLAYKDWKGDTEQAAFIEVYSLTKAEKVLEDLAAEFEKVYGFAPSLGDKYRCTSSCEKVGTYIVNGYSEPQTVYHYSITDKTYIYITNPMYEVYVQEADDGSVWVGYCIYATMDTVGTERNKPEVRKLDQEMYATFENLIGLSRSEMNAHKEDLELKIGYISEAGTVRSAHSDGLVDVLFIYCRGFSFTGND